MNGSTTALHARRASLRRILSRPFRKLDALQESVQQLPVLLRVQLAIIGTVLSLGVSSAVIVDEMATDKGMVRVAFATPALTHSEPWRREVSRFGNKVAQAFGIRAETAHEFAGWIIEAAERQQMPPELIASLVLTESSFRKNVVSHVGAVGPAQVRPDYWGRFCGASDLHDPEQNIYCGAQVLSHLRDRCGDEDCALQAYNVGLHSEREHAAKRYVAKVDQYRSQLENQAL